MNEPRDLDVINRQIVYEAGVLFKRDNSSELEWVKARIALLQAEATLKVAYFLRDVCKRLATLEQTLCVAACGDCDANGTKLNDKWHIGMDIDSYRVPCDHGTGKRGAR